nr:hypothetical protein [Tanacetum cinerariifolium]
VGRWLSWKGSHGGGDGCSDDSGGGCHGGCGGVVLGCRGVDGDQRQLGMVVMVAVVVWRCWWSRWRGRREEWRRVVASDIWDRVERVVGSIFGFARNAHRKTFPAAAGGGGWPKIMEWEESVRVLI